VSRWSDFSKYYIRHTSGTYSIRPGWSADHSLRRSLNSLRSQLYNLAPQNISPIPQLLDIPNWERALVWFPEGRKKSLILQFLHNGCSTFFKGLPPRSDAPRNLPTTLEGKIAVSKFLLKEIAAGRIRGPFKDRPGGWFLSPYGCVPKDITDYRPICHLSYPKGDSVNDGVDRTEIEMSLITPLDIITLIRREGPGCWLCKFDLKSAYRQIKVCEEDVGQLGFRWLGLFFTDLFLSFGLASSPFDFTLFSEAFQWILEDRHPDVFRHKLLNYLDDYVTAQQDKDLAIAALDRFRLCADWLGLRVNEKKMFGPCQQLTILGLDYDSVRFQLSVPVAKSSEVLSRVVRARAVQSLSWSDLHSLCGSLSFLCQVHFVGPIFIRPLREALPANPVRYPIRLRSRAQKRALDWWIQTLRAGGSLPFHCVSQNKIFRQLMSGDLQVFSDASTGYGFGARWGTHWFSRSWQNWPSWSENWSINFEELLAVVVAAETCGPEPT